MTLLSELASKYNLTEDYIRDDDNVAAVCYYFCTNKEQFLKEYALLQDQQDKEDLANGSRDSEDIYDVAQFVKWFNYLSFEELQNLIKYVEHYKDDIEEDAINEKDNGIVRSIKHFRIK